MTTNYERQLPPPTPLCAIFEPLLSLYCWQELDTTQMESLQLHVADCDYCQMQLEQYEAAISGLRAHLASGEQRSENLTQWSMDKPCTERAIRLTLDDITRADRARTTATRGESPTRAREISHRQERPSIFGPLAAVLVLALLAASLFTYLS